MVRSAEVLSDRLAETTDAINAWRAVLDDFGPETDTLAALSKLYRKAERWDDLAEVHDVWLSLTDEIEERVELYAGLADVRFQNLGDSQGALTAYHEVLRLDPVHEGARTALELMLEHEDPDIKREAAEIIGPLYEADGDAERLLKVLNIEIDSTFEPASRLATLDRALRTAEDVVENVDQAFDYAARGVREALGEPALAEWISTAERLAAETERWRDLLDLFEQVVGEMLDAEIQQHTRLRAGELARTMLEDNERATKHYRAALDAQGDDRDAMLALEELYGEADNNVDLLEILQLRAESSEQDEDRIELLLRVAKLQAGPLEERAAAIETYEDLIDLDLLDEAVASLEQLYRDAEQYEQVVSLCERQLDVNDGSRSAELRVRIAKVAHKHLSDTGRALEELGEALGVDPMHEGAITVLESLLDEAEEPDQRGQVAEMLEPVYLRQADWGKLRLVIDARLDTSQDPSERGELLTRLATLYEEQLEDYAMALETVARRLREEPGDENIWAEVERLGRVIGSESEKRVAEIFADALNEVGADDPKTAALCERTGELFAAVEQHDDALTWYRRAYAFSPESQELFKSIDEHLIELEQHQARVDHYRESLDHIFEDELRVERLSAIAKLQRDSLEQASEAIDTFVELLDIDDANAVALDALTDLFKETKQDEELAELYQRRADLADSPEVGAPYRLALAKLLGSKEEERDRALEQLEIVVIDLPWDESAIAQLEEMLEDEERKARVIDILRPLYEHANNWRGIIALNEQRLALADEPLEQVDILNETAMLWEDQGDDLQEAFDVVQKAFELQPDNDDTRANLERLTEAVEAWERLANSYERVANELQDAFVQQQMINALATICDERLDDPRRALRALGMLSALDPSNGEPLERMDDLCMLLGDWSTLATVLERKSENALDEDEKASMLRRLGEIKCDMLDDEPGAVETFEQALELAPENLIVLDQLIELYKTGKPQRLVELLEQRIDASSEEDEELRHGLLTQAAEVFERELDDRSEAVRVLQRALDARPTEGGVLSNLERLFRAEEMYDELLDNLKTQANVAEETSTRRDLRDKIGDLYISQFDNAHDALEQYRLVLEEDDTDQHAITAARKIGENYEELRLDVSALLEPVLSGAGRFDELLDIMELRFAAQGDPQERARTLTGMAMIQEEQLDAPETARDTLLRALQETPEDGALHDDIERLCELTDDHGKYADVLEQRADSILDAQVQTDLFSRFGRIAETRLKQPERAIEAYNKALEQAERPAELLEALDRLYEQTGDADKLASVIERRVDIEEGDTTQAELYFRLGKIQIVDFGDKPQGLSTLRMCVDLNPEHEGARDELKKLTDDEELFEEVAEALDVMYRVAQDSASRAWLRNKRISYAPSPEERIRLRLELAQMLEDESFDTASAQDVIQQALFDDASSEELMTQLERLAKTNAAGNLGGEAWRRAADALGKVVAAAFDVEEGDAREMSPTQARDLHLRAAGWYDEQVGDPDAAEKRLLLALEHDTQSSAALLQLEQLHRAPDREKDLVATLRRLAALAQSNAGEMDREPAELRREAKILAETALENQELAEEILREMLEANDADTWALGELSTIIEAKKDFEELYALLTRHIELASEADQLRELRHHAAKVAADELDQRDAAIDLYEQAFEDEPADADASSALRTLYQKLERHEDMLRLTERLIDLSESPEARAELRLESAQICISILEAPTEGIEHLRAVLDEVPGHDAAVELLGGLLEKEGRDEELAELLGRQITFARDNEDQEAELGYRVQLAELYETRLNDPNRAIDSYLAVLETDASFRPALESLARLYEGQDQTASAAKTYEKLIEAASQEELTRLALKARDLYVAVDEQAAASRVLETVLGSERSLSADEKQQLRDGLRSLYRNQSAWQELADLTVLEAGEAESEDEKVVLYRKAAALHAGERNDHAAAAELLEKALELKSEDRDLMLQLCDEYTASSRGRDAVAVLNQVVESYGGRRSKDLADIHHRIASAYRADGDDDAALRELESARKMDPGSIEVLTELGQLSIAMADQDNGAKSEHIKRAGNMFRSLLLQRLDDSSVISKAEVFYHLAEVNQREDDKKKAIHNLERALANDKTLEKARTLLDALKS